MADIGVGDCICGEPWQCTIACEKHGRVLHSYPCGECQHEWESANPKTAEAISRFAEGKGSLTAITRARKADSGGSDG